MAKKEAAKTVETKTVNTGFVDNVEALEAKMKEMREAQKIFATFTQEQVDKINLLLCKGCEFLLCSSYFCHTSLESVNIVNDQRAYGSRFSCLVAYDLLLSHFVLLNVLNCSFLLYRFCGNLL